MGTPFQEVQMAVSLSLNNIVVASPDSGTSANTGLSVHNIVMLVG